MSKNVLIVDPLDSAAAINRAPAAAEDFNLKTSHAKSASPSPFARMLVYH